MPNSTSMSPSLCRVLQFRRSMSCSRIEFICPPEHSAQQSTLHDSSPAQKVKLGMEQRDAAFLAGAKGATTIIMKKGKLTMPGEDTDISGTAPEIRSRIAKCLKPEEGDVVIIGSADTHDLAEYGAIAAAWTLIDDDAA